MTPDILFRYIFLTLKYWHSFATSPESVFFSYSYLGNVCLAILPLSVIPATSSLCFLQLLLRSVESIACPHFFLSQFPSQNLPPPLSLSLCNKPKCKANCISSQPWHVTRAEVNLPVKVLLQICHLAFQRKIIKCISNIQH